MKSTIQGLLHAVPAHYERRLLANHGYHHSPEHGSCSRNSCHGLHER